MTNPKLFLLYAPIDADWATSLYRQLQEAGYSVYMELPDSDREDTFLQRKTMAALQKATHLLAAVSKESALGEAASVFEAWWRPFLQTGRPIIACIVPDAPPSAEHWMPFDLLRQRRADFRELDGFEQLKQWIGPVRVEGLAISEPLASRAKPETRLAQPQPPIRPKSLPIEKHPTPPVPSKRSLVGSMANAMGVVIGLAIMIVLLFAASLSVNAENDISPETWLLSVLIVVAAFALIGRITLRRRQRQWRIEQRRQLAQARAESQTQDLTVPPLPPAVYVEVIQSRAKQDVGQIWAMDDFALTIGRGAKVDVPLRDNHIAKQQCTVFFDDGTGHYYLENLDLHERTVLYDRPLQRGEVVEIENGDMICLGKSVVLQFRLREQ